MGPQALSVSKTTGEEKDNNAPGRNEDQPPKEGRNGPRGTLFKGVKGL